MSLVKQDDYNDKDVRITDQLQREKRTVNPLTLLKEDLLKGFKDKEAKTECEEMSADLKTGDLSRLKHIFKFGLSTKKDKKGDSKIKAEGVDRVHRKEEHLDDGVVGNLDTEKINNNIKDRPNPAKDSEVDINTSKKCETRLCETQQGDETSDTADTGRPTLLFKTLFRRDHDPVKASDRVEGGQRGTHRLSERKQEQPDSVLRQSLSEQDGDSSNTRDGVNRPEDTYLDPDASEDRSKEAMCTLNTGKPTGFSLQTTSFNDRKHIDLKSPLTAEEPAQEHDPRKSEICLQQDDFRNNHKGKDTKMNNHLKTDQRETRTTGPLTVLTGDSSNVVKNKDMNVQHEDHPSNQTENKSTISRPKDDLSLTKEDFSFRFSKDRVMKSANLKMNQTTETSFRCLSLLKDDFANVFRITLSKEKDNKEISSKILKTERTEEHLKKQDCSVVDRGEVPIALSEQKEEQLESSFSHKLLEQNKEKLNTERINKNNGKIIQSMDSEPDVNVLEEKSETRLCETQQGDETSDTADTGRPTQLFKTLFRRDHDPVMASDRVKGGQRVTHRLSERKQEQPDSVLRQSLSEQDGDSSNTRDRVNWPDDADLDPNVSEICPPTRSRKTWQNKEIMSTGKPRSQSDEPSQDDNHRESVICLNEEEFPNDSDQRDLIGKHANMKDQFKPNESMKRSISPLTLFKEDFNHFKDDFLNVFRTGVSKDKDKKEGSSKTQTLSTVNREGLFRRDENLETFNTETMRHSTNDRMDKLDLTSETRFSEAEELRCTPHTVRFSAAEDTENAEREKEPSESLPCESSDFSLFGRRHADNSVDTMTGQLGGDPRSPKNYATYLTFDPNTANSEIYLTEANRKATRVWSDHQPSDHPDRFLHCPQVLCREGLLDSVYWEVEWSGGADIGVAYNSISRDRDSVSCLMGHNEHSWSLECSEGSYTPCYNKARFSSFSPEPFTHRVGVHLDWSAGTLSFYCICQDTMVHVHTFTSTFTEPLYAGFWIWAYESSVRLCQVELDWERLQ